jgi:tetratricopeptide (TPR) repeat protein
VPEALRALAVDPPSPDQIKQALSWAAPEEIRERAAAAVDTAKMNRHSFEQWIAANPLDRDATSNLLETRVDHLRSLGRYREALAAAREGRHRWPSTRSTLLVAELLQELNRSDEARRLLELEQLRTGLSAANRDSLTLMVGYSCAQLGDSACVKRVLGGLEARAKEGGDASLPTFLRGYDLALQGKLAQSIPHYEKSHEVYPDRMALNNIAVGEVCTGKTREARERWHKLLGDASNQEEIAWALSGIGYSYAVEDNGVAAWVMASAALGVTGNSDASNVPRQVLALSALGLGDLEEARSQILLSRTHAPRSELTRNQCFAHPGEWSALKALLAEQRGDQNAAIAAWIEAARSGHQAMAGAAREALAGLCP